MAQGSIKILKPRPNYKLSVISVAMVLFLIGLFAIITSHSQSMISFFKEQINVIAELKDSTQTQDIDELRKFLDGHKMVKQGSIVFISKEEASETMKQEFGENYLLRDMPNPLFDAIIFNVKSDYLNSESLSNLKSEIMTTHLFTGDVYFQETLIDMVVKNIEKAGLIMLILGLLLTLVAFTLIHNTVKLALYANRILIKNMELVGASWSFIIKPYLIRAIWQGAVAALIASLLLAGLCILINWQVPEVGMIANYWILSMICVGLLIIGVVIMFFSTYRVIHKYLRMRTGDVL